MADGLQGEEIEPLILKKKIKLAAGAHGGAWKVAYADFVTAMMAFFLLLWLLNATTEEQMTGLSDYFAPPSSSEDTQGIGEALAGMSAAVEGAMRSASSPPMTSVVIPSYGSEAEGQETGEQRESVEMTEVNPSNAMEIEQEEEILDDALERLRQSIQEDPLVQDLQDSIQFEITDEGLLIQLLDYGRRPMFEPGTDELTRRAIRLLALISAISVQLPFDLAISGHTDSSLHPNATESYTNWELSSDRAAASRRWMVENAFPERRIVRVEGRADSDLLNPRDPEDEINRRISLLLLREHPPEPAPPPILGTEDTANRSPSPGPAPARDSSGLAPPPLPEN
ncbi:MAG: flagellar motor protein MotB [Alphaproteobacteria bacterium]